MADYSRVDRWTFRLPHYREASERAYSKTLTFLRLSTGLPVGCDWYYLDEPLREAFCAVAIASEGGRDPGDGDDAMAYLRRTCPRQMTALRTVLGGGENRAGGFVSAYVESVRDAVKLVGPF